MLARLETEPFALQPCFVTSLAEQLQDEENALGPVQRWIEDRGKMPLTDLLRSEHSDEASQRISTANAFGSLRALSQNRFRGDIRGGQPGRRRTAQRSLGCVCAQRFRDARSMPPGGGASRSGERSRRTGCGPAGDRARRPPGAPSSAQITHAPYYLMADGVAELEASVGARVPFRIRLIRALRRRATLGYLTAVAGLSVSFLALALALAWEGGVHQQTMLAVLGALALFPLSELSIQIVNALVISLLPPDPLPKMDFEEGIPREHATLVVVPMMLTSLEVVRREVEKLEVRYLANREANLFFSLFSGLHGFPGADSFRRCRTAGGGARRDRSAECALSAAGDSCCFTGSGSGRRASGDGSAGSESAASSKISNAFWRRQGAGRFCVAGNLPLPIRYVITLDADTQLPRHLGAASGRDHRASAEPRGDRSGDANAGSAASPSFSRASASHCPAPRRRASRACSPTPAGPIPTARPFPTRSRICSAKRSSTARRFTTCRRSGPRSAIAFPRKRCSATI